MAKIECVFFLNCQLLTKFWQCSFQSRQEKRHMSNFDYLTDEISLKSTNPLKLSQIGPINRQITNSSYNFIFFILFKSNHLSRKYWDQCPRVFKNSFRVSSTEESGWYLENINNFVVKSYTNQQKKGKLIIFIYLLLYKAEFVFLYKMKPSFFCLIGFMD